MSATITSAPALPPRTAAPNAYRPDIDGLRAIAILSVALGHAGLPFLSGGFTGVDIFFVISGYLIGGHILAELASGNFRFLNFYARRARRILPALLATLVITLLAALVLLSPAETADLARSAFAAALSSSNILFCAGSNYFASKSNLNPLLMTWSLGVEEQFYLVAPLILVLLSHLRSRRMPAAFLALSTLSFALACWLLPTRPMAVFYLLPTRAWELSLGIALAAWESQPHRRALTSFTAQLAGLTGFALILAPIILLTPQSPFPGLAALPSVLGATLLIASPSAFLNRRMLSFAPLVFLGRISYSFYLWHWPALSLVHILCGGHAPRLALLAALAVAFLTAIASYYLIEQPFRRSLRPATPLLLRYAAATLLIAALSAMFWLSHGLPQRFPHLARIESATQALRTDPCLAGYGADAPNLSPPCVQDSASLQLLVIWGDSHAAALAPGLRSFAAAQNLGFAQLTKAACPPLIGATHVSPRIPRLGAECLRFNQRALAALRADPRIPIVLLNADWAGLLMNDWQDGWLSADPSTHPPNTTESRSLFLSSLASTIHTLQSAGKQVILVNDVPTFDMDPFLRIRTQSIPARRALAHMLSVPNLADTGVAPPSTDPNFPLAAQLLAQSATTAAVPLFDPTPALCTTPTLSAPEPLCSYRSGDTLLYDDSNHLSAAGAALAMRDLRLPLPTNQ